MYLHNSSNCCLKAFDWIVKNYDGDKYIKHFTCWNQLLVMMFGQLYGCDRLRELVSVVTAHTRKAYHLGFGKEEIKLANLAEPMRTGITAYLKSLLRNLLK